MRGEERSHTLSEQRHYVATWWLWLRFSVRRIISNPLRIAIVLLSVALATTLASAVFRVAIASIHSFEQSISGGERPFHAVIAPVGGRLNRDTIAPCLRALTPYADIVAIRRESAVLILNQRTVPVRVAGVAGFGGDSGAQPTSTRIITPELAESLELDTSKEVTLVLAEHRAQVTVTRASESAAIIGYADVVVELSDLPPSTALDSVALRFRAGDVETAREVSRKWLLSCSDAVPPLRIEPVSAPIERGAQLLAAYRFNIMIMATIALLVCVILISQATQITLRSVIRELAIVRTLGVSQVACLVMVVGEAALVSAAGSFLGVTVGAPLVVWITGFLTSTASEIYNLSLAAASASSVIVRSTLIIGAMTCVGALAALLGAREVVTLAPYRGTRREEKTLRPLRSTAVVSVAFLATFFVGCAVTLLTVKPSAGAAYLTVGVMIAWSAACIPLALYLAPTAVRFARRAVPARLAASALRVSGRSFVLSGAAVSVAVSLLVGLALMVSSFRETLRSWSAIRLAGDLFISSTLSGTGNEARIAPEIVRKVEALPEVRQAIPYYETTTDVVGREIVLGGVDLKAQCDRKVYSFVRGVCSAQGSGWSRQALASESAARKLGIRVQDEITVSGENYTIRGIIKEFGTEQPLIVIDVKDFEARYPGHYPETITVDLLDRGMLDATQANLRTLVPETLTVRSQRELLALVETLFNRTFRVTDSVRWIVFAMALLGLVSTVAQHTWERRRELRVSEVLGVSRWMLVGMVTTEAVVVSGAAVVVGIVGGIGIGWCLTEYINPLVFGWSLSFQVTMWPSIEACLFVACVGIVTPFVAARIIRRIVRSVSIADE